MKGKQEWIQGQEYLEVEEDWVEARYCFQKALDKNPSCADAMLGMYVLDEDRADYWLGRMHRASKHFGKMRQATDRTITATWQPMFFAEWPLSTERDLTLLLAKRTAAQGKFLKGMRIAEEVGPGSDRDRVLAYIFMLEGRYRDAVLQTKALSEDDPEVSLLSGICHYNLDNLALGREFLLQAEFLGDFYVRRHASYYLAILADGIGESEEAIQRLQDIAEHSPRYLQTSDLLLEIRAEIDPFWAIVSQIDED